MDSKIKVLITGASGRLGTSAIAAMQSAFDVVTLDWRASDKLQIDFVVGLDDVAALTDVMQGIDVVLHLAATPHDAAFEANLVPNNIVGVNNVYEAAVAAKVRRVVFASTVQTVQVSDRGIPITVDQPVRPWGKYGVTKVFGEALGRHFHEKHGLEVVVLRIGAFMEYNRKHMSRPHFDRKIWLSEKDAADIFIRACSVPDLGYCTVFCTSKTEVEYLDLTPARELLGYEPFDDINVAFPLQ